MPWHFKIDTRVFKTVSLMLGIISATGCQHIPPPDSPSSADLLNLSKPLETQEFRLPTDPQMKPIQIVVASSTDATGGYRAAGNYAEIARADLTDIFGNCPNYIVASRSVNRQASAESKLRQATDVRPAAPPVAADYI